MLIWQTLRPTTWLYKTFSCHDDGGTWKAKYFMRWYLCKMFENHCPSTRFIQPLGFHTAGNLPCQTDLPARPCLPTTHFLESSTHTKLPMCMHTFIAYLLLSKHHQGSSLEAVQKFCVYLLGVTCLIRHHEAKGSSKCWLRQDEKHHKIQERTCSMKRVTLPNNNLPPSSPVITFLRHQESSVKKKSDLKCSFINAVGQFTLP